mmetsp:Transcript_13295/g.29751  ORF Transcript_13295/g.29751 Transcript_13295/m.29751 type:complete len:211 (-) Transcript_13295:729-1361(-)
MLMLLVIKLCLIALAPILTPLLTLTLLPLPLPLALLTLPLPLTLLTLQEVLDSPDSSQYILVPRLAHVMRRQVQVSDSRPLIGPKSVTLSTHIHHKPYPLSPQKGSVPVQDGHTAHRYGRRYAGVEGLQRTSVEIRHQPHPLQQREVPKHTKKSQERGTGGLVGFFVEHHSNDGEIDRQKQEAPQVRQTHYAEEEVERGGQREGVYNPQG